MDQRIDALKPKERFSDKVEAYLHYRPHYPKEITPYLEEHLPLRKTDVVADIGSGTGFLAELFLENGNHIICVEPNKEMREAGEHYLARRFTNFKSVDASAEHTTLPDQSVDLVTVAQAFHWFHHDEFRAECRRILRGKHTVVLLWNIRDETESPFLREYESLVKKYGENYEQIRRKHSSEMEVKSFYEGKPILSAMFRHSQFFDFEGIKGRLLSSSYIPGEGSPRFQEMIEELKELFEKYHTEGKIELPHETKLFLGTL
jgi:SAM-dependent methyltransferase